MSGWTLGTHTGTHMDAPRHFIDGAPGIDRIPLDVLVGPALVADARGAPGDIDAAALAALGVPAGTERLLLRTRNEALWERAPSRATSWASPPTPPASWWRWACGWSGSTTSRSRRAPTRRLPTSALLEAGVAVVEGLDLRQAPPGAYELVCLPLRVEGADGAPARALLRPAST